MIPQKIMTKTMNKDFFVAHIKEPEGSPFD